jgi:transposase-like protein
MEFQVNAAGKRIYPPQFKLKVLEELRGGATVHELGRKYGVAIQNIVYWKQTEQKAVMGKSKEPATEEQVPLSDYKKAIEEIKNLRRSLVNMTVDRDILKEGYEIAVKKKWILPAS